MNRNKKRLLAVGVSAFALSSTPAFAEGGGVDETVTGSSYGSTLDITTIGDGAGQAGVTDTPTAVVNSQPTGWVIQDASATAFQATVEIVANGDVQIAAIATDATSASASVFGAILQDVDAVGLATGNIVNTGSLGVLASAVASTTASNATALANISGPPAVNQNVDGATATAGITNAATSAATAPADFSVLAKAVAIASTSAGAANAGASVGFGVAQAANSSSPTGSAKGAINNDGNFGVGATASAQGGSAVLADADVGIGVGQLVSADQTADATIANSGSFGIGADADATGGDAGRAIAGVGLGVSQIAAGADANVALSNEGTAAEFDVNANANATGDDDAVAGAIISGGVLQYADADGTGKADAGLTNEGSFAVAATADAVSPDGTAYAGAGAIVGVGQVAWGSTSAHAHLTNAGTMEVGADAGANGAIEANANALVGVGVGQVAVADGGATGADATAGLKNDGMLSVGATAAATAGTDDAGAVALVGAGALQVAVGTTETGAASFTNNGTFEVGADAKADGGEDATAIGIVGIGQAQLVYGDDVATAGLTNTGSMALTADAVATAGTEGGPNNNAVAAAGFLVGNAQVAWGDETASANLVNSATASATALASISGAAKATASAAYEATALAGFGLGMGQVAVGQTDVDAGITNDGSISYTADAKALSGTNDAHADAGFLIGGAQIAYADDAGTTETVNASALLEQSSGASFTAKAKAESQGGEDGWADVAYGAGFVQAAISDDVASAAINNDGAIDIGGSAKAETYSDQAGALSVGLIGVAQVAWGETASATFTQDTSGSLTVTNSAYAGGVSATGTGTTAGTTAIAAPGTADAYAALGVGFAQVAVSTGSGTASAPVGATASIDNAGAMDFGVDAKAWGSAADADANLAVGILQAAYSENSTVSLKNSGSISVGADANATAKTGGASANAVSGPGVLQIALGSVATMSNAASATMDFAATALANGVSSATASAVLPGAAQIAIGTGEASTLFTNDGTFTAKADADAVATSATAVANADAFAAGLNQLTFVSGTTATPVMSVNNAGSFSVTADAKATADAAYASAVATGVRQIDPLFGADPKASFTNTGSFGVQAIAVADGVTAAEADADATGFLAFGDFASNTVVNGGDFDVLASAQGTDAVADANGISIFDTFTPGLAGTVTNSGNMSVVAKAAAGTATASASSADAAGIALLGGPNNMTVNNTGSLAVTATVANGGTVEADGIIAFGFPATGTTSNVLTINNSGSITAWESVDGGGTFQWGNAINVQFAPNAVDINLLGDGSILGNIEMSADDAITVSDGETSFEGIINPDLVKEGSLTIASDGTLFMVDNPEQGTATYNGPAAAYVDDLTIEAGGTLALELPSYATSGTVGDPNTPHQQIFANTADITGGILEVRPSSDNGLYANEYYFDNVIDADTLTGTFASVDSGSILLDLEDIYDADDNVDLGITRVAFDDARFGLTPNQAAAAGGIEDVYAPTLTGDFADMLAEMFTLSESDYTSALSTLHGAQYATYLQSLGWMGSRFNGILNDMGECAAFQMEDSTLSCRRENDAGIWGTLNYGKETIDSDLAADATGYDGDQWMAAIGADVTIGDAGVIGVAAGYIKNEGDFDWYGGSIDSDGYQIGLYGAYDPGQFYVRAAASYSDLSGDSARTITVGSISGIATASPDANIWAVGGELGYRFALGGATLTPYAGLDYVSAELEGFTESSTHAGALIVHDSKDDYLTSELGLKLSGDFNGIVPELKAGWRHEFDDDPAMFTANYAAMPNGAPFTVISPNAKEDAIVLGASISAKAAS